MNGSFFWGLLLVNMFGALLSLSSENWFSLWLGMEIQTLFMIPIISTTPFMGYLSWVVAWKYFIFQFVGSIFLFLSLVLMGEGLQSNLSSIFLLMGVSLKVGLFPFHTWMFHVLENSSMKVLFFISSTQKVVPLIAIFRLDETGDLFLSLSMLTALWSSISSFSICSVKLVLVLSSMLMTAWICFCGTSSWGEMVWFFLIYSIHLGSFLFQFKEKDSFTISSLFDGKKKSDLSMLFLLGAMIGLPPCGVFLMKVEVIWSMVMEGVVFPSIFLVTCSSLMMMGYLKVAIPLLLQKKETNSPVKNPSVAIITVLVVLLLCFL